HQSIGFKLADMKVRLDAAECLLQRALNIVNETPQDNITIPLARLFLGESVMAAAIDAAQILGGYGFYPENHVERYYRDAKLDGIGGGTSEIQRLIISRELLRGSEKTKSSAWMSDFVLPFKDA